MLGHPRLTKKGTVQHTRCTSDLQISSQGIPSTQSGSIAHLKYNSLQPPLSSPAMRTGGCFLRLCIIFPTAPFPEGTKPVVYTSLLGVGDSSWKAPEKVLKKQHLESLAGMIWSHLLLQDNGSLVDQLEVELRKPSAQEHRLMGMWVEGLPQHWGDSSRERLNTWFLRAD